jgi:hypothetical protein
VQEGALQPLLEDWQTRHALWVQEGRASVPQQHLAKVTGVLLLLHLPSRLLLVLPLQCCCHDLVTLPLHVLQPLLLLLLLVLMVQKLCDVHLPPQPPPPSLQL